MDSSDRSTTKPFTSSMAISTRVCRPLVPNLIFDRVVVVNVQTSRGVSLLRIRTSSIEYQVSSIEYRVVEGRGRGSSTYEPTDLVPAPVPKVPR